MKLKYVVCIALLLISTAAYAATFTDKINWSYGGVDRAREWVSPDGRMSMEALNGRHTALDMWPHANPPTEHSLTELTLYRTRWDDEGMERINFSAMVDQTDAGAYRIGVEHRPPGIPRPIIFCFESVNPGGAANCQFRIAPDGVYVNAAGVWRRVLTE